MQKRVLDISLIMASLPIVVPLMLAIAVASCVLHGKPVIFRQQRAGRDGCPFKLWKFRTMRDALGPDGHLLPDADRLTPFGRWLRSTSLDELPELWNVLRGEMSLVGPRPLHTAYLPRYTSLEARRHEVRPGLTGWAQVNGRNTTTWEDRLAMDIWYVDRRSLCLDIRILARTVHAVLARQGISAEGEATMQELRPELGAGDSEG